MSKDKVQKAESVISIRLINDCLNGAYLHNMSKFMGSVKSKAHLLQTWVCPSGDIIFVIFPNLGVKFATPCMIAYLLHYFRLQFMEYDICLL